MVEFVNAKEMNEQNPDTFWYPSEQQLSSIGVGDDVKICDNVSRFWCSVIAVDGDKITATVDNDILSDELKFGDTVEFTCDEVYDIWKSDG